MDMSSALSAAIDELQTRLDAKVAEVTELKRAINVLCVQDGREPAYADVHDEPQAGKGFRTDAFAGKPLATAMREIVQKRGACLVDEFYDSLVHGGFIFDGSSDPDIRKRNLSISLGKNMGFIKLSNGRWALRDAIGRRNKKKEKDTDAQEPETATTPPATAPKPGDVVKIVPKKAKPVATTDIPDVKPGEEE
jgi:hypothetical protein